MSRWLLFAHQLPVRPSHIRVKTWRRLQQIGAVQTRNGVYVLPNTSQCREDFEWLRSEVEASGGGATVFAADSLGAHGDDELLAAFQQPRAGEYRAILKDATPHLKRRRQPSSAKSRQIARLVRALRERLADVQRVDFFHAPGQAQAIAAVTALEQLIARAHAPDSEVMSPSRGDLSAANFHNSRWVTRPRPGVDRMASAWLIRTFIDPKATFGFAEQPQGAEIPFDMYTGEFSHQGSLCTFETVARRFGVNRPAVEHIGQIVHDLDMKDVRYAHAETAGIGCLVEGFRLTHTDDHALLEQGIRMFDALAESIDAARGGAAAGRSASRRSPERASSRTRDHRR